MQLFYNSEITKNTSPFTFDKIESRHIIKVLRKKEGDMIYLTNGKGMLFTCKITDANDKKCTASIIKFEEKQGSRDYYLHIAIAPTKNLSRMEWFLEKATEIGIDEITPIICDHSERQMIKPERFHKIIQSAMKQSLQFRLPKLNDTITFSTLIKKGTHKKMLYYPLPKRREKKATKQYFAKRRCCDTDWAGRRFF